MGKIVHETVVLPFAGGDTREINIYLPRNYDKRTKERFPVLYMHDGQNLFYNASSYQGVSWGVKQTLEAAERKSLTEGIIVVGIVNNGDDRMFEYSPFPFAHPDFEGAPEQMYGVTYIDWIVNTLKPMVDETYRTLPEAETTWMAGSSAGSNITFYAGLKYPTVFSKVGLFSTATWLFDDEEVEQFLFSSIRDESGNLNDGMAQFKPYIYVGTEEGYGLDAEALSQTYLDTAVGLTFQMIEAGLSVDQLRLVIGHGQPHHESAWRLAFPQFFEFLMED